MRSLLLNGTVGVGKTSVAETMGALLALDGMPHAVVDLDWLRKAWPAPADDRFNERLALQNLEVVARNFADAGARLIVVAGVIETAEQRTATAEAIGGTLWCCRLTVDQAEGEARLRRRHGDDESALSWHLHRFIELDAVLASAGVDDVVIDTTNRSVADVARDVLGAFDLAS